MKILRLMPIALGMALVGNVHAADIAALPARTAVVFDHPENFTDVKDRDLPSDSGRDEILSRISTFMVSRATPLLPAGDSLQITFTDIDLAGDFAFDFTYGHHNLLEYRLACSRLRCSASSSRGTSSCSPTFLPARWR